MDNEKICMLIKTEIYYIYNMKIAMVHVVGN